MNRKILITVILTVFIVALLSGCVDRSESETQITSSSDTQTPAAEEPEGTIRISGAFALYPMMLKWGEEYQKLHPKVKFDISAGGAGKGMADTLGGLVDIGMVSREITPEEEEKGAYWIAITKDAVVPTVNSNNPAVTQLKENGLKRDVFEQIYINGTIKTWGQATGDTGNNDKINVYTRSDAAGAPATWAKYLGNYKQEDLKGVGVNGDPGLAEAVRQDKLGIGYNNINFAYDPNTRKPVEGIEIIPLDLNGNGKIDTDEDFYGTLDELVEAIGNDQFPSPPARDLNLVTKGKPTGIVDDFIKWTLTDGQKFISESGYIVLPQDQINEGIEKVD
ncbi:substrate-binding domain-containing protein [Methanolobus zinderi]|uniref:Substrate-binding domain-containing protein n=1 Tax=Methanolobus zinderi TaxID=536044 RepID=A0A7D5I049_9EURY|nr:substrate-binding domain-containing protein [Methanolobus zinderi]QLC49393.1 substrate-binding domain-containing protein [Methanolobus zinderi]QLC49506.1 substrate-binding domain-containing protein [Methanolobus zinderi]